MQGASWGAGGGAQPLEQAAFRASVQMGRGPLFHSPGRLLWEAANLPLSRRTWSRHCALLIVTMSMESERSLWVLRTSARSPWPDQTDVLWRSHIQPPVTFCSRKDLSDRAIKKYDLFTKQSIKKSQNDLSLALSHVAVLTGSSTMKQLFLPR